MAREQWPRCLCLRTQSQKLLPKVQLPGWLVLPRWAKTTVTLQKECGERGNCQILFTVGLFPPYTCFRSATKSRVDNVIMLWEPTVKRCTVLDTSARLCHSGDTEIQSPRKHCLMCDKASVGAGSSVRVLWEVARRLRMLVMFWFY